MDATGIPIVISIRYLKNVAAWSDEPRAAVVMTAGSLFWKMCAISANVPASFSSKPATTAGDCSVSCNIREEGLFMVILQFSILRRSHRHRRDNANGYIQRSGRLRDARRA